MNNLKKIFDESREEELESLIEEEFEIYINQCDLDEDRCIDHEAFAKHAKEMIELEHGKDKFDDFNIESYALEHASGREEALIERAVDAGDALYEEQRESHRFEPL